jgi:hypothetical protein
MIVEEVAVRPAEINLGPLHVGELAEATLTLHSRTDKPFTFDRTERDDADVVIEPLKNSAEGNPRFRVLQQITQLGDQSSQVRLFVRTPADARA